MFENNLLQIMNERVGIIAEGSQIYYKGLHTAEIIIRCERFAGK